MATAGLVIWLFTASVVTAGMYMWDKRAAIKNRPRIAERTLLIWSAAGGWPGGMIAGIRIRHKTQKASYRLRFTWCVVMNIVVVASIVYFASRGQ